MVDVCNGHEPEYTNGRKDFILERRLEEEGTTSFQFSSRVNRKFFKLLRGEQVFLNIRFQFQEPPPPRMVTNDTSLMPKRSFLAQNYTFIIYFLYLCISLVFKQNKNIHMFNFSRRLISKTTAATSLVN